MSTTFEEVQTTAPDHALEHDDSQSQTIGQRLQSETTAVRLRIRWPGIRKTLSKDHRQRAAGMFEADTKSVSASKKLFDTAHPAFRAATAVKTQATDYWKRQTLPYIEPGVRLLRRNDVAEFDRNMRGIQISLAEAVEQLRGHYSELVSQARERLGDLFDAADYVDDVTDLFEINWEYPSSEPPDYLLQVSPQLYQSECSRVKQRFDEAVRMAEQAFADELGQLVSHLAERLSGEDDGTPKVFRDSAITNLTDFFERFQRLNIRSDQQLDHLVTQARDVIRGVDPQSLRDQSSLRQHVGQQLARVESTLDQWMTDRPRRSILRRAK